MARLDADLLLMGFKTAHYAVRPNPSTREDLTAEAHSLADAIREEIDARVEEVLRARGIGASHY